MDVIIGSYCRCGFTNSEILVVLEKSHNIKVSLRTLEGKLQTNQLWRRRNMPDEAQVAASIDHQLLSNIYDLASRNQDMNLHNLTVFLFFFFFLTFLILFSGGIGLSFFSVTSVKSNSTKFLLVHLHFIMAPELKGFDSCHCVNFHCFCSIASWMMRFEPSRADMHDYFYQMPKQQHISQSRADLVG